DPMPQLLEDRYDAGDVTRPVQIHRQAATCVGACLAVCDPWPDLLTSQGPSGTTGWIHGDRVDRLRRWGPSILPFLDLGCSPGDASGLFHVSCRCDPWLRRRAGACDELPRELERHLVTDLAHGPD